MERYADVIFEAAIDESCWEWNSRWLVTTGATCD